MANPRIEGWRPRGGLGYLGIVACAATLVLSVTIDPVVGLPICTAVAFVSIWLASGLRADHSANEMTDEVVYEGSSETQSFSEFLLGDRRTEIYRISSIIIAVALIAVAIATYRFAMRHGPEERREPDSSRSSINIIWTRLLPIGPAGVAENQIFNFAISHAQQHGGREKARLVF